MPKYKNHFGSPNSLHVLAIPNTYPVFSEDTGSWLQAVKFNEAALKPEISMLGVTWSPNKECNEKPWLLTGLSCQGSWVEETFHHSLDSVMNSAKIYLKD